VISTILPLAWITGADIYVDELDKTFVESMETLQQEYKKMYTKAPFTSAPFNSKLIVKKIVENKISTQKTALLFSGGLDSTYSLLKNISLNPRLIMIFGADIPISNVPFQELVKKEYSDFAEKEGVDINFIHTNSLEILNRRRVEHFFWNFIERFEGSFLTRLQGSILQFGHVAPLSIGRFNQLLTAGAITENIVHSISRYPWTHIRHTDELIRWANIKVRHDGPIHRHKKVFGIRKYLNEKRIKLRVCQVQPKLDCTDALNCSGCEKCLVTIASLVLAGIDPNKCGFNVDNKTFELMRELFEQEKIDTLSITLYWRPLQQATPDAVDGDLYGSKQFSKWFKKIDLDYLSRPFTPPLSLLYYKLPYPVSNFIRKVFHEPHESIRRIVS
jgi:hypothetical protein